jgi:hypothetical protein
MHTTGSRPKRVVSADGHGVVSHAGSRLPADLADATGLTGSLANALHRLRPRSTGHDPGRVAVDLAVMLADGGEAIADLALLRDRREVYSPVASTLTAWRRNFGEPCGPGLAMELHGALDPLAPHLAPAVRECVLLQGARIALADGPYTPAERETLATVGAALTICANDVTRVLTVVWTPS